jgi:hypothetical protein
MTSCRRPGVIGLKVFKAMGSALHLLRDRS